MTQQYTFSKEQIKNLVYLAMSSVCRYSRALHRDGEWFEGCEKLREEIGDANREEITCDCENCPFANGISY